MFAKKLGLLSPINEENYIKWANRIVSVAFLFFLLIGLYKVFFFWAVIQYDGVFSHFNLKEIIFNTEAIRYLYGLFFTITLILIFLVFVFYQEKRVSFEISKLRKKNIIPQSKIKRLISLLSVSRLIFVLVLILATGLITETIVSLAGGGSYHFDSDYAIGMNNASFQEYKTKPDYLWFRVKPEDLESDNTLSRASALRMNLAPSSIAIVKSIKWQDQSRIWSFIKLLCWFVLFGWLAEFLSTYGKIIKAFRRAKPIKNKRVI